MDQIRTLVQPKARQLGAATNTEEAYLCTRTKILFLALKKTHNRIKLSIIAHSY